MASVLRDSLPQRAPRVELLSMRFTMFKYLWEHPTHGPWLGWRVAWAYVRQQEEPKQSSWFVEPLACWTGPPPTCPRATALTADLCPFRKRRTITLPSSWTHSERSAHLSGEGPSPSLPSSIFCCPSLCSGSHIPLLLSFRRQTTLHSCSSTSPGHIFRR